MTLPNPALEPSWLVVAGTPANELASQLESRVQAHISKGDFRPQDVEYIRKVSLALIDGTLNVDALHLEKLRILCQLWDVDLRPSPVTSHRKFVGPCIVAVKKFIFPILRAFLKDTLRQQRTFNAATISLLAELANASAKSRN